MFRDWLQDRDTDIISAKHKDIVDNDEPRFMDKDLFNTEWGIAQSKPLWTSAKNWCVVKVSACVQLGLF